MRTHRVGACIGLTFAFGAAIAAAGSSAVPTKDLEGYTSSKDFASGVVPISAADVQFYLKTMQGALGRYQHPSVQDVADLAESKRYEARMLQIQQRLADDPGNPKLQQEYAKAFEDPSPAEAAMRERGDRLRGGRVPSFEGLPELLVMEAGMPADQWERLAQAVEDAAGIERESKWGSGSDEDPTGPDTPEKKAHRALFQKAMAASRSIAAPQAAEIRRLHEQTARYESDRAEQSSAS